MTSHPVINLVIDIVRWHGCIQKTIRTVRANGQTLYTVFNGTKNAIGNLWFLEHPIFAVGAERAVRRIGDFPRDVSDNFEVSNHFETPCPSRLPDHGQGRCGL